MFVVVVSNELRMILINSLNKYREVGHHILVLKPYKIYYL